MGPTLTDTRKRSKTATLRKSVSGENPNFSFRSAIHVTIWCRSCGKLESTYTNNLTYNQHLHIWLHAVNAKIIKQEYHLLLLPICHHYCIFRLSTYTILTDIFHANKVSQLHQNFVCIVSWQAVTLIFSQRHPIKTFLECCYAILKSLASVINFFQEHPLRIQWLASFLLSFVGTVAVKFVQHYHPQKYVPYFQ